MKRIYVINEEELNNEFIGIFCKIGRLYQTKKMTIEKIDKILDYPVIALINEPDVKYHGFIINVLTDGWNEEDCVFRTRFNIKYLKTNTKTGDEKKIETEFKFETHRTYYGDFSNDSILKIQNGIFNELIYFYSIGDDGIFNIEKAN